MFYHSNYAIKGIELDEMHNGRDFFLLKFLIVRLIGKKQQNVEKCIISLFIAISNNYC